VLAECVSRRPFGVPLELLAGEPAHALHVGALDLPAVDAGFSESPTSWRMSCGAPASCRCSRRPRPRSPRRRRRSSGRAAPPHLVVADVRRAVEARRRQRDLREVGPLAPPPRRAPSGPSGPAKRPSANATAAGRADPSISAATAASRSRSVTQASRTAAPLRSAPLEAAVAEVLGTLSVCVFIMRTRAGGTPSSRIATPWIFV
jgi:hypothetical protein